MPELGLNESQIQTYRREGYIVVPSLFAREDLRKIDRCIEELTQSALTAGDSAEASRILELEPESVNGKRVPRRIYHPFLAHDSFRNLATDARILDKIESLIGPDIAIQHSKLNMKPAKVGSVVEWHQDLTYFPHTNDDLVTTLVYLDDATEENGCLQVLPRHHTHYFNHMRGDGTFAGMITEEVSDGRYGRPVPLEAPAGSAIFMHCLTPHSSLPNRSSQSRRTLIFEFRAADAFPIYYGEKTGVEASLVRHLRGKVATHARFGNIRPYIPTIPKEVTSLYDLQSRSRKG